MITPGEAIAAAKAYVKRHKMGWSESDVQVVESDYGGIPCLVIHTATIDLEGICWLDQVTATPLKIYVNALSGKCFAYEYGNRGVVVLN